MEKLEKIKKDYRNEIDPYENLDHGFNDSDNDELMKRAYNQALEDVKGNVGLKITNNRHYELDRESIDKLKIK